MSFTKRYIEDQMEMGNDVLHPEFEDEMLDQKFEEWVEMMESAEDK